LVGLGGDISDMVEKNKDGSATSASNIEGGFAIAGDVLSLIPEGGLVVAGLSGAATAIEKIAKNAGAGTFDDVGGDTVGKIFETSTGLSASIADTSLKDMIINPKKSWAREPPLINTSLMGLINKSKGDSKPKIIKHIPGNQYLPKSAQYSFSPQDTVIAASDTTGVYANNAINVPWSSIQVPWSSIL
jgi:hypothetical protein